MTEKSIYHIQGERNVHAQLRGRKNQGELGGREPNQRVAEAMAYAAKPLVEKALEDLQGTPNNLAVLELPNGEKGLTNMPGTVSDGGYERPYAAMAKDVSTGYDQANQVQEQYYDGVAQAQEALKRAKENI